MTGIRSFLGYRTLPTTALITTIYLIVFIAISFTDILPDLPHEGSKKLQGLDLKQARRDLERIAARPHPYNSHANDAVRAYLLSRLEDIAWQYDHVTIDNDMKSNGSWASAKYGVYFEGTNLLVKIRGTDDDPHTEVIAPEGRGAADGVLFSAHYDSVSTAPGATDDGMGVTTLLQLIQYFSEHRQKKTAIFNINNGEEDWLNGAHAFLEHPWANLTSTFLNLEGAAAGGRPILFRASSLHPLQAYRDVPFKQRVRHPHANVLSSDAFARGVIRSGTDYSVYTGIDRHGPAAQGPMLKEGLDVAFYKGRSRYHTKWDGPSFTEGGERSLWSMIDVAKGVGIGLLNPRDTQSNRGKAGVYFDLFKTFLISFSLRSLLVFNIVSLVVGPITLGLLFAIRFVLSDNRKAPPTPPKNSNSNPARASGENAGGSSRQNRSFGPEGENGHSEGAMAKIRRSPATKILVSVWKQASFWIALVLAAVLQGLVAWGYVSLNPFTVYSRPYMVLLSFFSLTFFTIDFILKVSFPPSEEKHSIAVREAEKATLLLHMHFLAWVVLLVATIFVGQAKIGGTYAVTVWYVGTWAASALGTLEPIVTNYQDDKGKRRASERRSSESSERTPLLGSAGAGRGAAERTKAKQADEGAIGWWIVQVLLTVPAFILLLGQIGTLLLDSMSQTIGDGGSLWGVYIVIALLSTMLVFPVAPFSPKLSRVLTLLSIITFGATTAYLWLVFPFSRADPLKVYFQQTVAIDPEDIFTSGLSNSSLVPVTHAPKVMTELTGPASLIGDVLPFLPSSREKDVNCSASEVRVGLTTCRWESKDLAPSPGGDSFSSPTFFKADIKRSGWDSATIYVQGRNTRNCRLYFDPPEKSGVKVTRYVVKGGSQRMQSGYPVDQEHGVQEIRLWSRTWDREWEVDVDWETPVGTGGEEGTLSGRVACEWAEYQSGMVDNGSVGGGSGVKIPALEEVLTFLPEWVAVTKAADGLVEASVPFTV